MIYCWYMNKYQQKHIITLSSQQKKQLQNITRSGKHNTRVITRARVLLKSAGGLTDKNIGKQEGIHYTTVERIRTRFCDKGLDRAIYDAPRSGYPPKLNEKAEAHLVAIACSDPPEGRDHWTLELLQKRMIRDRKVKNISTVALWKRLKERGIKPWREKNIEKLQLRKNERDPILQKKSSAS